MSKGTPRVSLRLDPTIRRQLEAVAQEQDKTLTEVIKMAIQAYLDKEK